MVVLDWLKPAVIFGSIFYAFIGVLILWVCFVLFDKITPYRLWEELTEKKNVALAIVVGAMVIAIAVMSVRIAFPFPHARWNAVTKRSMSLIPMNGTITPPRP